MIKKSFLAVFTLVIMLITGCQYTKTESQIAVTKSYSEEEIQTMLRENKYPKEYLKSVNDTINTGDFTIHIKSVTTTKSITGLDENDFLDFDQDIRNRISSNNEFNTYDRSSYTPINGGLETKNLEEKIDAQPELLLIDFSWINNSKETVMYTITPGLCFCKYVSLDDEFVGEQTHIQYRGSNGERYLHEGPIYFSQSQYKNSDNQITRVKKFFVYDFKPNEELNCTLGYIIDKDLENDVYLAFLGGQLDTLVKVF